MKLHAKGQSAYGVCGFPEEFSMRSKLTTAFLMLGSALTALILTPIAASAQHPRPKITGISHIAVYTSDPGATNHYYVDLIGAAREPDPENPKGVRYAINATQFIEVLPLPPNSGVNRLDHTAYNTDNAEGLRLYLADKGWKVPGKVTHNSDGSKSFRVHDPEEQSRRVPPALSHCKGARSAE
jgi:catechol 2,3-dioxygenase-like lactoylglutathione lyase family enzyme